MIAGGIVSDKVAEKMGIRSRVAVLAISQVSKLIMLHLDKFIHYLPKFLKHFLNDLNFLIVFPNIPLNFFFKISKNTTQN